MKNKKLISIVSLAAGILVSGSAFSSGHNCTPTEVMAFNNRIHVHCSNPVGTIRYFAVSTSSTTNADRFMKLASTALVSGKTFYVNYGSSDTSGASFGCQAGDCRKANYFAIR